MSPFTNTDKGYYVTWNDAEDKRRILPKAQRCGLSDSQGKIARANNW